MTPIKLTPITATVAKANSTNTSITVIMPTDQTLVFTSYETFRQALDNGSMARTLENDMIRFGRLVSS